MKIVLGGHWTQAPDGWLNVPESEQDITQRLKFENESVDCIFNEHVWEHLPFIDSIFFAKECLRVLKSGGVLRIATPVIDKLISFENNELGKHYSEVQTKHYYPNEDAALKELGLDGIREEPISFIFDSLIKGHNHRHVWTSSLLKKVLEKIGFSEVYIQEPGETNFNKEDCLERTIRGVNPDFVYAAGLKTFDPETKVIEAKK